MFSKMEFEGKTSLMSAFLGVFLSFNPGETRLRAACACSVIDSYTFNSAHSHDGLSARFSHSTLFVTSCLLHVHYGTVGFTACSLALYRFLCLFFSRMMFSGVSTLFTVRPSPIPLLWRRRSCSFGAALPCPALTRVLL